MANTPLYAFSWQVSALVSNIQSINMKTLLKNIITILLIIASSACNKSLDLDVTNPNRTEEPDFWVSGENALQGINAVYGNFYRNGPSRWLPYYMDVRSDDGYSTSPWNELRSISALNTTDFNFEVQCKSNINKVH